MSKQAKLIIASLLALISSLIIPIFTQWYFQQTGMYPIGFWFIYILGGIVSIIAIATDNFKNI